MRRGTRLVALTLLAVTVSSACQLDGPGSFDPTEVEGVTFNVPTSFGLVSEDGFDRLWTSAPVFLGTRLGLVLDIGCARGQPADRFLEELLAAPQWRDHEVVSRDEVDVPGADSAVAYETTYTLPNEDGTDVDLRERTVLAVRGDVATKVSFNGAAEAYEDATADHVLGSLDVSRGRSSCDGVPA